MQFSQNPSLHGDRRPVCEAGHQKAEPATTWGRCVILAILLVCTGCRSLRPSDREGLFAASDLLSTDNIRGPLERALGSEEDALRRGEKFSPEAMKTVETARRQFEQKEYSAAIKTYQKVAKEYPETSIGEEAWFHIGEAYFAQQEYPKAQDAYDKLFADYPSTRYVADASQRMFHIAKLWLDVVDPVVVSNVKTVSHADGPNSAAADADRSEKDRSLSERYGLIPNFFDSQRPMFDTSGRARNALRSIWLNDPTGPLADDALMLTASYYLKRGNHVEADRYLEILREEYPDSPHLEDAFVLGAHVKQAAYQGPYYDKTTLVAAENLSKRTLTMFPNSDDRQQLRKDLSRIYLLKAEDAWSDVVLWKRKDNPRAVAIQAAQLIATYPDTEFARMARQELLAIEPNLIRDLPGMQEALQVAREAQRAAAAPSPAASADPARADGSAPTERPPGI